MSRRRIGGSPIRFKRCNTNSVGCHSIGKSNVVSRLSRMPVKCPASPRVICNFKTSCKFGGFSVSMFFRKLTERSF